MLAVTEAAAGAISALATQEGVAEEGGLRFELLASESFNTVSEVSDPDAYTRKLAAASLAEHDPTGWFERLYTEAARGAAVVPWDRGSPHQLLVDWVERERPGGRGRRAVVVGCG